MERSQPVTQAPFETITPSNAAGGQCSFTRPSISVPLGTNESLNQGLNWFRKSANPNSTAYIGTYTAPQPGCIDIERSAFGPGSDQANDGAAVFIPFAVDGVTGAVGSESSATFQTNTNAFTLAQLTSLYSCGTVTVNGVTYDPNSPLLNPSNTPIDLYYPVESTQALQSSTGVYWSNIMGFAATTLPACLHSVIAVGPDTGQLVTEDDGTAVSTDPNGFMPFSISGWIAQRNGHNDHRHGAVLTNINGTSPFSNGNPTTGNLNISFPITREVYNVVLYNKVTSGMPGYDPNLAQLLAGTGSLLCRDVLTILNYGFALLSTSTPDQCGATTANLRAFNASHPL